MAGLVAIGVGACGDDVQIVEPTPPPPPPLTATMAPASATVAVGNSVVFAVNASGGAAGAQASWTCASSNTGIATASDTGAGCQATGVVAGGVTITAAVTKGSETVNVGAQLTVTSDEVVGPSGDPAFVLISRIEDASRDVAEEDGTISGRVEVDVSVERGNQILEVLSLLVDGAVVNQQTFGSTNGMTPPEDELAEQAGVHTFTMSFESDGYDPDGTPDYQNGEHTVSAELQIQGAMMADGMMGHETLTSNVITVEFDNTDFIGVSIAGLGDGAMNPQSGQIWYGGPDVTPEITATPVYYTGGSIASLTLISFCGADAQTVSGAPFSFPVECKNTFEQATTPTFTVEGDDIITKAKDVYLDFKPPVAPTFKVNPGEPGEREDGWVNAAVDFLGKYHKDRNPNGWLNYHDDDDATGVGGYTVQLRFSSTTPSIVDGAREATPNALPTAPTKENAACVIATAVDLLGNESKLPSAGSACAKAADYMASEDGDYPGGLRAGLDVTAPTIEFTASSPKDNSREVDDYQVRVEDEKDGSGMHSTPVLAALVRRDAKNKMICGDDDEEKMELPGSEDIYGDCQPNEEGFDADRLPRVTTTGLDSPKLGYHTFTAMSRDKAGNVSDPISRVGLHDTKGLFAFVGTTGAYDAKKAQFPVTVTLKDDYSIRDYRLAMVFGDNVVTDIDTVRTGPVMEVADYNAPDLMAEVTLSHTIKGFRAVQATGTDGVLTALAADAVRPSISNMRVWVRDHGDAAKDWSAVATAAGIGSAPASTTAAGFAEADPNGTAVAKDEDDGYPDNVIKAFDTFTFETDEASYDSDETIELTAEVTGIIPQITAAVDADPEADPPVGAEAEMSTPGLLEVPFLRVDFYATSTDGTALQYITSMDGDDASEDVDEMGDGTDGTAGTDDDTDDDERTFTYDTEISAEAFLAAVDSGSPRKIDYGGDDEDNATTDTRSIYAVGVRADGLAVISQAGSIVIDR